MNSMGMDKERVVEQWLDDSLAQYGKTEPRPGLEMRVMASLHAEKTRIAAGRRWWWGAGLVAATSAALVTATLWFGQASRAPRSTETSIAARHESSGVSLEPVPQVAKHEVKEGQHRPIHRATRAQPAVAPKLEQFPAPAPLNEQERLLARYVEEFPQKAALVARVQTELRIKDEREMAAPWPKDAASTDLQQQE